MLAPNASQALAMAVHELAINAAMYGALSTETGRLDVSWQLIPGDAGESLALDWRESGGPSVLSPSEPGFGSTAIQGAIEHQLGGSFDIQWAPTGMTCRFVFPLSGNMAGDYFLDVSRIGERPAAQPDGSAVELGGKRVLVVEDEALIALTLMDAVREAGCTIVGPASTVAAAIDLARKDTPDLAILDVDLAGTGSAPVAIALRSLGVPFVYCTGYAETAVQIEPELRAAMLTKPIDAAALEAALREALNQGAPRPLTLTVGAAVTAK
jgi:CheY-like chemotaxis protein